MIIPKNEKRIFDSEILDNGIKIIYVEDSFLDKTSVSVSVKIGSLANPKEYQGLAHFLEHMLFLGSKKYPQEDYYEKEIKKYGGMSNAYTENFETVYYFSSFNNGIEHIMDVFAQFFIEPLFSPSAVNREINAVNNEHQKNINDDSWRIYQLSKNVAKKNNHYNTFPTGSIITLQKNNLRQMMIDFWERYYVSENISLCIVSNLKIQKQKELINHTFGKIKAKKYYPYELQKPIFNNFDTTYQMIPTSNIQMIKYYWEIPNDIIFMKNKIFVLLANILAKSEDGSLFNHLKELGYIDGLIPNVDSKEGIFSMEFHLTLKGLNHLDEIDGYLKYTLEKIFELNWENIIDYYKKLYKFNFDYGPKKESLDLAIKLCNNAHYFDIDDVYYSDFTLDKINKNTIKLAKPYFDKHFKILVKNSDLSNPIIDANYGTKYQAISNINSKPLKYNYELNLKNEYLDTEPKLITYLNCNDSPTLIREKTWYGGCSNFGETSIEGYIIIGNSNFFNTSTNYLMSIIMKKYFTFYLNKELYNLLEMGFFVSLNLKPIYNSIVINFNCPNDPIKFNNFVNLTLKLIDNPIIVDEIIHSSLLLIKQDLENINNLNPWEYSSYYLNQLCYSNEYSNTTLLKDLSKIKYKDITKHINNLLDNSTVTMFFYGNLTKDQFPQTNRINKLTFNPNIPFPNINLSKSIEITHPNKEEKNNCVSMIFPVGLFQPYRWLQMFIIYLILESKFYVELRTKKQLGYLVNFNIQSFGDYYYFIEKIQSNKICPEICTQINIFNNKIINFINKSKLDNYIKTAENYLENKENSISDFSNRYFGEIISRNFLFNRKKLIKQQLEKITKESLITFAKEIFIDNNEKFKLQINAQS